MEIGRNRRSAVGVVGKALLMARQYFARRSGFHREKAGIVFDRAPATGRYQLCPVRVPATPARVRVRR